MDKRKKKEKQGRKEKLHGLESSVFDSAKVHTVEQCVLGKAETLGSGQMVSSY